MTYAVSHQTWANIATEEDYRFPGRHRASRPLHETLKGLRGKKRGRYDSLGWFLELENHWLEASPAASGAETYKVFIKGVSLLTESQDPYTAGHQVKVSELAQGIAREMGLSEDTIEGIRIAGMVHDMGKMAVPAEIVTKPAALTPFEFSVIKKHPAKAYEVLKEVDFPWPVAEMVLQHHERLNGSGYPHGLKGDEICLEARVLAVADVVGAICSHRPYRRDLGIKAALKEIDTNQGVFYDKEVTKACRRSLKSTRVLTA